MKNITRWLAVLCFSFMLASAVGCSTKCTDCSNCDQSACASKCTKKCDTKCTKSCAKTCPKAAETK